MDPKIFGCLLILFSVVSCQVLNGYINPLWMSRRGRARNYDLNAAAYYLNSPRQSVDEDADFYYRRQQQGPGRYDDDRRVTDLLYMDERGRYYPVFRQDRLYSAGIRQQSMYRVNEQQPRYMPVPVSTSLPEGQPILPPSSA